MIRHVRCPVCSAAANASLINRSYATPVKKLAKLTKKFKNEKTALPD